VRAYLARIGSQVVETRFVTPKRIVITILLLLALLDWFYQPFKNSFLGGALSLLSVALVVSVIFDFLRLKPKHRSSTKKRS